MHLMILRTKLQLSGAMKLLEHNHIWGQISFKSFQIIKKASTKGYNQIRPYNLPNLRQHFSNLLKNPPKATITGNQYCRFLYKHQNFGSMSLLNQNYFGQFLSGKPKNVQISTKILLMDYQLCRFTKRHQHFGSLSPLNKKTLSIYPKNVQNPTEQSILSTQNWRFFKGHQHFGSLHFLNQNNFGQTLSSKSKYRQNLKKQLQTSIWGQQHSRFLKGHQIYGSLNLLHQKNYGKNQQQNLILCQQPCRYLKLLEYQGIELLQANGIPTGKYAVVKNADEAEKLASDLQVKDFMVKAQVMTGGRGKGKFKKSKISGVRMATTPEEVGKICKKMLGDNLVTNQTRADGIVCNAVLVAERHFPRKELYFSIAMDRAFDGTVVIASTQGGMDIEEVASVDPTAVLYQPIDAIAGLKYENALEITKKLNILETPEKLAEILTNLYKIFQKDAILVELNPLALDIHNNYLCLDCKMEFDDSADFKHPELFSKKDNSQLDVRELAAAEQNINYIPLNGNIGCMVNGAGLAMATMDIIKLHGGDPANFLDVGGGATIKTVETCFEIITSDKNVDCIFVNIFGGIMRCDIIAQGIVAAALKLELKQLPIVCRLRGTNVSEAKAIIAASEMRILTIDELDEGAKVAVKVSKIRHLAKEVQLDVNFELIGI